MCMKKEPLPIVFGDYLNALGIIRSLGMVGVSSVIMSYRRGLPSWSRYRMSYVSVANPGAEPDRCGEQIIAFASQADRPLVLFPTNEAWLAVILSVYDRLLPYLAAPVMQHAPFRRVMNKTESRACVAAAGVPVPGSGEATVDELIDAASVLQFPLIVKGIDKPRFCALLHRANVPLETSEDLSYWVESNRNALAKYAGTLAIEEIVPGPDEALISIQGYANEQHDILAHDGYIKLRQSPPKFGCALAIRTCSGDEIIQSTRCVIRALEYVGQFDVEFKRDDRDGVCRFIELNPRPGMLNFAATYSGVNLAAVQYIDCGGCLEDVPSSHNRDVNWVAPARDLVSSFIVHPLKGYGWTPLRHWLRSYKGRRCNAEFQWADPLPGCYALASEIGVVAKAALLRLAHRLGFKRS